jgi:hypothetical protein
VKPSHGSGLRTGRKGIASIDGGARVDVVVSDDRHARLLQHRTTQDNGTGQ